jgi:hypothetical protein
LQDIYSSAEPEDSLEDEVETSSSLGAPLLYNHILTKHQHPAHEHDDPFTFVSNIKVPKGTPKLASMHPSFMVTQAHQCT